MNTIKWNLSRTGFVLTYKNGTKETYTEKVTNNNVYVRVNGLKYWLSKIN